MEIFEHANHRFLRHIFRILAMAEHAIAETENLAFEAIDESHHGPLVSVETSTYHFAEVVTHSKTLHPFGTQSYSAPAERVSPQRRIAGIRGKPPSRLPSDIRS